MLFLLHTSLPSLPIVFPTGIANRTRSSLGHKMLKWVWHVFLVTCRVLCRTHCTDYGFFVHCKTWLFCDSVRRPLPFSPALNTLMSVLLCPTASRMWRTFLWATRERERARERERERERERAFTCLFTEYRSIDFTFSFFISVFWCGWPPPREVWMIGSHCTRLAAMQVLAGIYY